MIFAILFGCLILGLNAIPTDITEFFPIAKSNLTKITWAHAVNSQSLLKDALNSSIMMLEADVVIGKLTQKNSTENLIPVMGHPPSTTSDLSLVDFIQQVLLHNLVSEQNDVRKGIKLDFKSIEAFEKSLTILEEHYLQTNCPLWLNADILPGPIDSPIKPVDPDKFLPLCKHMKNAMVSIGWTTNKVENVKVRYTLEHVEDMFDVIKYHAIKNPITIPIRAGFAAESFTELKELLFVLPPGTTITLWHKQSDYVNLESLSMIINSLGVGRVFIDLPPELLNELHLDA